MADVVIVPDDGADDAPPGPDPLTLLHDRVQAIEERLGEMAHRDHAHAEYATHEQLQGYAALDHEHGEYVTRPELDDELDDLVTDLDDDLEEALGAHDEPMADSTAIAPASFEGDDEPERRPGLFW